MRWLGSNPVGNTSSSDSSITSNGGIRMRLFELLLDRKLTT